MWLAVVVMVIGMVASVATDRMIATNQNMASFYQNQARQKQMARLAENFHQYYLENGSYPTSIQALTTSKGFEHTATLGNNWQGYTTSGTLNDGTWQYQRMVLYTNNPIYGATAASYLTGNTCGTGTAQTDNSGWCGAPTSLWYRHETREKFAEQINTERAHLHRVLQKLADWYSTNGVLPSVDQNNNPLAANSITSLRTLAGYSGTVAACKSNYQYSGIPIDCADMADLWGNDVGYQFIASNHIMLVSESPIFNNSGQRVVVAADFQVQ